VLEGTVIEHYGQFVAVAIAESFEQAEYAASLVRVRYSPGAPLTFARDRERATLPSSGMTVRQTKASNERGNVKTASTEAAVAVEEVYRTPMQHHCAMEPHATLA